MSMFGNAALFFNNFGDTTPPAKPSLSTVDITDTSIIISGSSTDNITVTGYDVYVDAVLYDTITGASFTGYSIGGLASETNYDIYIIAKDLRGNESIPSDTINFTTDVYTPPLDIIAPTWSGNNLSYTAVTSTGVTLNWTAATDNVGVTGYSIYKDNNLLLNVGNVLTYNITGLIIYTTYGFKLKATDAAGNVSDFSNTVTFTTVDSIAPSKPVLSYHTLTGTSVMINGSASDNVGVVEYDVYLNGVFNKTIASSYFTNELITGLDDVTGYSIYITAKDAAGNESVASDAVTFTTDATFALISYEFLTITDTSVEVRILATEQCSINYYVDYVLDDASSGDFNATEVSPNNFRHTRIIDGLSPGTTYDLVIDITAQDDGEIVSSGIIPMTTTGSVPTGTPVLSNFHIDNAQLSRVYFDSSSSIVGMTSTGFIISGKTISSVTVNGTSTTGHYFTVTEPFTFWDNNTIRLGEHTDVADRQELLHNFTLEYITNNINEPTSLGTVRYAWAGATGANNGTSEANAYTSIATAFAALQQGDILYVKASQFTSASSNTITVDGTATNPVKIIGYKTTPGDITSNYYTYSSPTAAAALNVAEMPIITATGNTAVRGDGIHYVIFKNIQVANSTRAFNFFTSSTHTIIENCNTKNTSTASIILTNNKDGSNLFPDTYYRVKNTITVNASTGSSGGIILQGSKNLIENCKAYEDGTQSHADYTMYVMGDNSIIRNCIAESQSGDSSIHGIHVRGADDLSGSLFPAPSRWNLIEKCLVKVGSNDMYTFRNANTDYNVIKNSRSEGFNNSGEIGISVQTGAKWNVYENMYINNCQTAIGFLGGTESENTTEANNTANNLFKNIIANTCRHIIYTSWNTGGSSADMYTFSNNTIAHLTSYNSEYIMYGANADLLKFTSSNNVIKNSIIHTNTLTQKRNTDKPQFAEMWTFENTDLYNINGTWDDAYIGSNGNINVNPDFADLVDFIPQTSLPTSRITGIYYDYDYKERGSATTMGAQRIEVIEEPPVDPPTYTPDYYVSSSTGSDSNDGLTELTAWATMSKVNSSNVADKVVAFKGGDSFTGTITKNYLGTQNTVYTSYGIGKAKIIGHEPITGWVQESTNLWYASTVGKTVYHVMIGEDLQTNARIPKISSDFAMQGNYYEITSVSSSSIFIAASLIGSADLVGAYCYVKSEMDTLIKRTITAFNTTTGQVTLDSAVTGMSSDDIFFVNNHKNITTAVGDWYYDSGNNRLYIYSITSPTNINAITKADRPFFFEGSDTITFDNIEFNGLYLGAIYFESGGSYIVQNCSFKNIYENPIHSNFGVTTATIADNVFENLNSAAVNMYSTNINTTINNNEINNVGLLSNLSYLGYSSSTSQGTGLALYKGSASGNTITNCGYNGIAAYGGGTVENNFIEDVCLSGTDGAGIYTYEHATYGSIGTIQNNIIINNNSLDGAYSWQSMGIYCDQSSQDVQVLNNSVTGYYHNIFMNHGARNSFTGNKLYKSYREPILMKMLDGFVLVNESNVVSYNEIYSDSNTYDCVKHYNEKDATLGWVSYDYNKYFNPQLSTSIYVIAQGGLAAHDTLAQWQTRSGQDANSIDDSAETITDSYLAYNSTGSTASISLPTGTWKGLDGIGSYTGTITLAAYTGKILIK